MNIPKKKTCIECKNPFITVIENQVTCNNCLTKPFYLKERYVLSKPDMEENMNDNVNDNVNNVKKQKICEDCKNPFSPKGNRQKWCDECREKRKLALKPKSKLNLFPIASSEEVLKNEVPDIDVGISKKEKKCYSDKEDVKNDKNQRISIKTFIAAGEVLLSDLDVESLRVSGKGLIVSVERIRK